MASSSDSLTGVSRTALGVAALRARETARPDRLFEDPYAQAFVDAFPVSTQTAGEAGTRRSLGEVFYSHVVIRTRFFDEYLLAAVGAGCEQVVLLAAGLDTRAFRLPWPESVRLFEVDLPEVFAFKEQVLAERKAEPRCERNAVPADLRDDWSKPLIANGFRPGAPTAWLAEGLLIYLSPEDTAGLLTTVGKLSAPGSRLSFEQADRSTSGSVARVRAIAGAEHLTTLWKGGLGTDTPDWLARHGWHTELQPRTALADSYGRPAVDGSSGGFLTAVRS
jgi:methyltransferase (TIGR00027 family)